jgi:hypothetical protein
LYKRRTFETVLHSFGSIFFLFFFFPSQFIIIVLLFD